MSEYAFLQFPPEAVETDDSFHMLPESAKRVFDAIRRNGPVSHQDLRVHTRMPPRTIRFAVRRLRDEGYVDSRSSLRDCRTCYFFVDKRWIDPSYLEDARDQAEVATREHGRFVERV